MGILRKMFYTDYICQMKIINNMNERIDLTKILKDCPRGTKLYCSIYGEVEFVCIDEHEKYPIKVMVNRKFIEAFSRKGFIRPQYNIKGNLFPSEVQYDWSKCSAPWFKKEKFDPNTLKPLDKVMNNAFIKSQLKYMQFLLSARKQNKRVIMLKRKDQL